MAKKVELTDLQKQWALHYATDANMNKTEAARLAGYKGSDDTLRQIGYQNYKNPKIRAYLETLLAERVMGPNEVLARIDDLVRGSLGDFWFKGDDGRWRIDIEQAKAAGKMHLLKKFRVGRDGVSIELHDPQTALMNLAKHYGLMQPETEITINVTLVQEVVDALKAAGDDPETIFNRLIERARERAERLNQDG